MMTSDLDWRNSHRIRLHHFANDNTTTELNYLAVDLDVSSQESFGSNGEAQRPMSGGHERVEMKQGRMTKETASRFFFDIALAGEPIQCSEEDGTCDALRSVPASPLSDHDRAELVGMRLIGHLTRERRGLISTSFSSISTGTDGGQSLTLLLRVLE